jgi:Zn-dependent M28 family amino/carboxypeptidase
MSRRRLVCLLALPGLVLAVALLANLRTFYEGSRFIYHGIIWDPGATHPIDPDGPYGLCYDLVEQTNSERCETLLSALGELDLVPTTIPVAGVSQPNILVAFGEEGPYSLFVAHFDKSREDAHYQGASDNTAALCALVAAARTLATDGQSHRVALLLTSGEERGLLGAKSFLGWMEQHAFPIEEVINLDMIGRRRLATRPSAWPGLYFWVPGLGQTVFDGQRLSRAPSYPQPDAKLVSSLKRLAGRNLTSYRRFTAHSDSNIFQEAGLPTVCLSSDDIYYLNRVWEQEADRIELLDERNLELAAELVVAYARTR